MFISVYFPLPSDPVASAIQNTQLRCYTILHLLYFCLEDNIKEFHLYPEK